MTFPNYGLISLVTLLPSLAVADIAVSFRDGAPKDRFTIENVSSCVVGPLSLTIDMTDSAGRLVLDVTDQGAGVEVFQPLELIRGSEYILNNPDVEDGQSILVFELAALPSGADIMFTLDVDDTVGQREITVTGSEMQGSILRISSGDGGAQTIFSENASALIPTGCPA